jgi:hypothetical protein
MKSAIRLFMISALQLGLSVAALTILHPPQLFADEQSCENECDGTYGNCGEICSPLPGGTGTQCFEDCSSNYNDCDGSCGGSSGGPSPNHACVWACDKGFNRCMTHGGDGCSAGQVNCCEENFANCLPGCTGE